MSDGLRVATFLSICAFASAADVAGQFCLSDAPAHEREAGIVLYNSAANPAFVRVSSESRTLRLNVPTDGSQFYLGPSQTILIRSVRGRYDAGCVRVHASVPIQTKQFGNGAGESARDTIWITFGALAAAYGDAAGGAPVSLRINPSPEVNARTRDRNTVEVNLGLARRLPEADELAFGIAHEFGHVYQYRTKRFRFSNQEEVDADAWAVKLMADAGYEASAAVSALVKLRAGIETTAKLPPHLSALFDQRMSGVEQQIAAASSARARGGWFGESFFDSLAAGPRALASLFNRRHSATDVSPSAR